MRKDEFLSALRARISGLPKEDIERTIAYYGEIIDDRMEDGLTEEEAVEAVGSIDEIVSQILADTPLPKLVKAKVKPKRAWSAGELLLLVLGFPLWFPLLIAAATVVFVLYVVLWSVIVVLYAVAISVAACAVAGIFGSLAFIPMGNAGSGVLFLGTGLFCAGVTIFLFLGFHQVAKGILLGSKKILLGIKSCFVGKGGAA